MCVASRVIRRRRPLGSGGRALRGVGWNWEWIGVRSGRNGAFEAFVEPVPTGLWRGSGAPGLTTVYFHLQSLMGGLVILSVGIVATHPNRGRGRSCAGLEP